MKHYGSSGADSPLPGSTGSAKSVDQLAVLLLRTVTLLSTLVMAACGGGGTNSAEGTLVDDAAPLPSSNRIIRGNVYNTLDRQPVSGATIFTSPATQSVRSNLDGTYQVIDTGSTPGSVEYALRVAKSGYAPVDVRVAATSGENIFDIPLVPDSATLIATPDSINIPFERNTATFFVNGTFANSGFTLSADAPWLSITPSTGTITNSDGVRVTVTVDRGALAGQTPNTAVIVQADSGDTATVNIDVEINSTETPRDSAEVVTGVAPTLRPNQADCRRDDILRVAGNDPNLPLVVFPQTTVLPGDEGNYTINQLPFLIYADSFQINTRGTLSVSHTTGGDITTVGSIFDIDLNNYAEILADDSEPLQQGRRSALTVTLEPGIYCYLLRPPMGVFLSFAQMGLRVEFSTE